MNELTEFELATFRAAASAFLASFEHVEAKHPELGVIPVGSVPGKQLSKVIAELRAAHPGIEAFEFRGVVFVPIVSGHA